MTNLPETCPCCGAGKLEPTSSLAMLYECSASIAGTNETACGWKWWLDYASDYRCPAMWRLLQETRAKLAALEAERGKP